MEKEEFKNIAQENASTIEDELNSIGNILRENGYKNYKNLRNLCDEVQKKFKELKPIFKEDRDRLWSMFTDIRDSIRNEQDEYFSQSNENKDIIERELNKLENGHWSMFRRDYEGFWNHTKEIQSLFNELKPIIKKERDKLWEKFNDIRDNVRKTQDNERIDRETKSEFWLDSLRSDIEYSRPTLMDSLFQILIYKFEDVEYLKECGQNLNKARKSFSNHKDEMLGKHKQEIHEFIQEVQEELDLYREHIKGLKSQKYYDYQDRVRANIEKNRSKLDKANSDLDRINSAIESLSSDIYDSHNDNWISKAEGWLSEKEEIRDNILELIERLESKIEEDEAKLE